MAHATHSPAKGESVYAIDHTRQQFTILGQPLQPRTPPPRPAQTAPVRARVTTRQSQSTAAAGAGDATHATTCARECESLYTSLSLSCFELANFHSLCRHNKFGAALATHARERIAQRGA